MSAYSAFTVSALEMQRRTLEELTRDKIEHVVKESKAKYKSELVKEVHVPFHKTTFPQLS